MTSGGAPNRGSAEHPPGLVRNAAQRAFRERTGRRLHRLVCVFDSVDDEHDVHAARVLMLAAAGFDVLLTISPTPSGNVVAGAVLGASVLHVAIRRPMRATIEIPLSADGRFTPTFVPSGTGSVLVDEAAHISWRSDWFTL